MKYKIVSDSSANVYSMSHAAYCSVPLKIISPNDEYTDNEYLDVGSMVASIKATSAPATTSCPNMHEWSEAFSDGENVFAVSITSQLSGSYNAAIQAAGEFKRSYPDRHIWVLDSLSTGPEMQLILEKLEELVKADHSFEEIRRITREYSQHTHLLFALQSLDNLAKNGRCSKALAKVAGVLGIRLIGKASDQGTLEPLSKARGEKKTLELLLNELARGGFMGGKVRIAHCFNLSCAEQLRSMILSCYPGSNVEIVSCGGLCSYYADLGGILVGYEDSQADDAQLYPGRI